MILHNKIVVDFNTILGYNIPYNLVGDSDMFVYVKTSSNGKKTNKKVGWKQTEEDHKKWLLSHGINPNAKKKRSEVVAYTPPPQPYRRETPKIESLNSDCFSPCTKRDSQRYTGTLIKGIATMHKSNAIPIISDEHAIEVAKMRRG